MENSCREFAGRFKDAEGSSVSFYIRRNIENDRTLFSIENEGRVSDIVFKNDSYNAFIEGLLKKTVEAIKIHEG